MAKLMSYLLLALVLFAVATTTMGANASNKTETKAAANKTETKAAANKTATATTTAASDGEISGAMGAPGFTAALTAVAVGTIIAQKF